jgi:hypothetical protein
MIKITSSVSLDLHTQKNMKFFKYIQQIASALHFITLDSSDGRYYRKSIEMINTYKSIDTFDTRKKYR